jgi:Family of unknown function (DUF5694)
MKTLVLVLIFFASAYGQTPPEKPEILILGSYHMANPGRDVFNMQADDVLSPKRQKEIVELIEVLKKFKPTKVAIETNVFSKRRTDEYANYLAGKHTLTQNEIEQIGFRLAKELGHPKIYPVDADGDFPMGRVMNYAKANGRKEQLDATMGGWGDLVKKQDEFLRSHTVLEMLKFMNTDTRATHDMGLYFELVRYGDAADPAGADLLAAWYQRNIRIYQNIVRLIESPKEKILVVYGAGHLGWLRQNATNDLSVRLRKLSDLKPAK